MTGWCSFKLKDGQKNANLSKLIRHLSKRPLRCCGREHSDMGWPLPGTLTGLSSGFSSGWHVGRSLWRSPARTADVSNKKQMHLLNKDLFYFYVLFLRLSKFSWIEVLRQSQLENPVNSETWLAGAKQPICSWHRCYLARLTVCCPTCYWSA